jgi:hypothetical protein
MRTIISILFILTLSISCSKQDAPESSPTVITLDASEIKTNSFIMNGEVSNEGFNAAKERGFVWSSTNSSPSVSDSKINVGYGKGKYSIILEKLIANTTYYVKAFATNDKGTSYGETKTIKTTDYATPITQRSIPSVGTTDFQEITQTSVKAGVEISSTGGVDILEFGVCLSTNRNPTILDRKVIYGTSNSFGLMDVITGLASNTTYYLRGYAINSIGLAYGPEKSFTTLNLVQNTLRNGLIAYYPFNGNANDASGNGKNGFINGGVTNTTDRFGKSNSAFLFNGLNGFIEIPSLNTLPYKPISYSAWVIVKSYFPARTSGFQFKAIIGRNTAYVEPNGVIGFVYLGSSKVEEVVANNFFLWRGGGILTGKQPSALVIPPLNTWVHIVFTQNSNGDWKWYQNGILTNSGTFTDSQSQFDFFQIGSCNNRTTDNDNTFWNDKLDDIGIWNRVISDSEVDYLYKNDFQP